MKKLTVYTIVSFILFITGISFYSFTNQTAAVKPTIAHTEALETYDYIITNIDNEGITGKSLNDNTGIYLIKENIKGLQLNIHDSIRVSFPKGSYEQITRVEKLSGQ